MKDKSESAACGLLSCGGPDLCLDHVDASGAEGFDTIVDVHHAFALSHVQHDVQHDVAAGAACPNAATQNKSSIKLAKNCHGWGCIYVDVIIQDTIVLLTAQVISTT